MGSPSVTAGAPLPGGRAASLLSGLHFEIPFTAVASFGFPCACDMGIPLHLEVCLVPLDTIQRGPWTRDSQQSEKEKCWRWVEQKTDHSPLRVDKMFKHGELYTSGAMGIAVVLLGWLTAVGGTILMQTRKLAKKAHGAFPQSCSICSVSLQPRPIAVPRVDRCHYPDRNRYTQQVRITLY